MNSAAKHSLNKEELRERVEKIDFLFTHDADYLEYLYGFVPGGLKCKFCESTNLSKEYGDRTALCLPCGKITHLTASTVFHGVRMVREWVITICLLEDGSSFSESMLAEVIGMARSSVSAMMKKLFLIVSTHMGEKSVVTNSAEFLPVVCKRSLETPAKKHPRAEQIVFDELACGEPGESIEGIVEKAIAGIFQNVTTNESATIPQGTTVGDNAPDLWANEKKVFLFLSGDPVGFDSLSHSLNFNAAELSATLTTLELAGLIEPVAGNRFVRRRFILSPTIARSDQANAQVDLVPFFDFIRNTYHGISRKYLQPYLGAFWCFIDRKRWTVGALFRACLKAPRITNTDLLSFVSPLMVHFCSK